MKPRNISTPLPRLAALALCFSLCLSLAGQAFADKGGKNGGVDAPNQERQSAPKTALASGIDAMPRMGVQSFFFEEPVVLEAMKDTGAKVVRIELSWSGIEPANTDPANYHWGSIDRIFESLSQQGLSPVVTILNCPIWACVRDTGPMYDDMYDDFAQFMGALSERYSQAPYNVHYWEFWNEPDGAGGPNMAWGWGSHPDKYARMLSWVYPAIKVYDPQSVVMTGGLAFDNFWSQGGPFNDNFLTEVLRAGGGRHLDAVAFHYYKNNAHAWTHIGMKTEALRRKMTEQGVNLPIVCTETGLTSSTSFGSSEAIQARYLVQMTAHGASANLKSQMWYIDRDMPTTNPDWEIFASSGLLRVDNSRKPAHTAMRVFSEEIGSGAYLRKLGPADGVDGALEGYRFKRDGRSGEVSVVWNNAAGNTTMTMPSEQAIDLVRAKGLMGQELQTQEVSGGARTISVGADPVYLEWGALFSDVPGSNWSYPYVEYLSSRGVIGGYTDNTFRPGNSATRGQFAKMIVLGMGWQPDTSSEPDFADVPRSHTFYGFIQTAYARGIIGGYACGRPTEPCDADNLPYFRSQNNITRAQIAKIVVLSKGWQLVEPATATFSDVAQDSPFYSHIETAFAHSVVGGYADGTFRPGNNATRAQLSKMLSVALQQE